MQRSEGIRLLTRCANENGDHWSGGLRYDSARCPTCHGTDDAGHLRTFSRYGRTSAECAPVAWRLAYVLARETGEPITYDDLDYAMSLVVNDHDDVAYIIRTYGHRQYT